MPVNNNYSIHPFRRRDKTIASAESARLSEISYLANLIQADTGCGRGEALIAADALYRKVD
jgi:cyclopropane fatty-acyl-phospholipid synthase-like methyltransferase